MPGEAGNGKGRPGKALPSCHQPLWSMLAGISKEDRTVGVGTPAEAQGPPVLKVRKRAYLKGEML